jgi:hypothetical protein
MKETMCIRIMQAHSNHEVILSSTLPIPSHYRNIFRGIVLVLIIVLIQALSQYLYLVKRFGIVTRREFVDFS